jgi:hypothetical protein
MQNRAPLCSVVLSLVTIWLAYFQAAKAAVTFKVDQVGSDVVITGSGTADLTGLNFEATRNDWVNYLTDVELYVGPDANPNTSATVSLYRGLSGPLAFGGDPLLYELPASIGSSGDLFGIMANNGSGVTQLVLPAGYTSGSSLSGVSTFPDRTLGQLGFTPGQASTWTWGTGPNEDSLRLEVAPAPAPILGALASFRLARQLRRRIRAIAA